jgi:iron(III) transport system ATP-binding protein
VTRIALRGVVKAFGTTRVLDGVDLEVAAGEGVVLLGPSGCGKTTVLRLVAGLDLPDAGEVLIDGEVVSQPGLAVAPHRRGIGFAFQRSALWPHLTVAGNVAFALDGSPRGETRRRVGEMLERLGLDGLGGRYPDQLSGGQARRVGLARALVAERPILLLDEPLTNIEPDLKTRLLDEITAQRERTGASVLYVTHDADEASGAGTRVLRIETGRARDVRQEVTR